MDRKIRVLVVPSDTVGGVGFYRSIQPHVQLHEQFSDLFDVVIEPNIDWTNLDYIKTFDILNFHKGVYDNMVVFRNALSFCKDNNIVTIMDIDDNWDLHKNHPLYASQRHYKMDEITKENFKLVDYVTTTTPYFANKIKKFNPNVFIFQNAINPEDPRFKINKVSSDKLRIGLIMGSSHEEDMKLLQGVVAKLPKDVLDKIVIVLCGYDLRGTIRTINTETGEVSVRDIQPKESVWYRYEQCVTNNYKIISPEYKNFLEMFIPNSEYPNAYDEGYKRCWTKDINNYYKHYNEVDVLLVPLVDNDFNNCKSPLKVAEACFSDTAIIASDSGPYQIDLKNMFLKGGALNPEGNALLVEHRKDHKDWAKNIIKCANDPSLVRMMKDNLYRDCHEKYDLRNVTIVRKDFYEKIVKRG